MNKLLEPTYDLIKTPKQWTQGMYAKDADGDKCNYNSPNAVCFCLSGALNRAYELDTDVIGGNPPHMYWYARTAILQAIMNNCDSPINMVDMPTFNDSHSHADVIELLMQASNILDEQELSPCTL